MQISAFNTRGRRVILGSLFWLLTGLFLSPFMGTNVEAASDVIYFPLTNHYMSGAFKNYWEKYGGLEQYGYALTEPYLEKSVTDGNIYITQVFERAIFEYHPENAGPKYEVLLSLLGRRITFGRENETPFKRIPAFPNQRDKFYFSDTGHSMGYAFKGYWEQHGGLAQFGFPISEEFQEWNPADNKVYTVQYYERARFEFHPELIGTKYVVLLGLLGWQQMNATDVRADVRAAQGPGQENSLGGVGNGAPKVRAGFDRPILPIKAPHLSYGMNVWMFSGVDKGRVLGLVQGAGFNWIRQQVTWENLEPNPGQYNWGELDQVVDSAKRANVRLLLSVVRSPHWAGTNGTTGLPADPATFGNFMRLMAQRYKGKVDAYEIWNEQNIERETGGGKVLVAPYVATLKAAYTAIKAVDPWAAVLYGGLSPTGINDQNYAVDDAVFLEQSYKYNNGEIKAYFDALGAHPGSHANTPDELWPNDPPADKDRPWSTHPSFYFRRVENLRAIMEKYGDGYKQMWLTEFGWTTKNAAPGYEYGALNTEEDQANYLVRAYQRAKTMYPWMGVMTMWQLNFATVVAPTDEKAPWGILNADWSPRPAYYALAQMAK